MNNTTRRGFLGALAGAGAALAVPDSLRRAANAAELVALHFGARRPVPALGVPEFAVVAVSLTSAAVTVDGQPIKPKWAAFRAAVASGALQFLEPDDLLARWPAIVENVRAARANRARPLTREERANLAAIRSEVVARHGVAVWRRYRILADDWVRLPVSSSDHRPVRPSVAVEFIALSERDRCRHGSMSWPLSDGRRFIVRRPFRGVELV